MATSASHPRERLDQAHELLRVEPDADADLHPGGELDLEGRARRRDRRRRLRPHNHRHDAGIGGPVRLGPHAVEHADANALALRKLDNAEAARPPLLDRLSRLLLVDDLGHGPKSAALGRRLQDGCARGLTERSCAFGAPPRRVRHAGARAELPVGRAAVDRVAERCCAAFLEPDRARYRLSPARMSDKTWEELLVWKLTGARYDEHKGVELADLAGLVALRNVLVALTNILWKRRYDKKKIPDLVEDRIDLRIERFEDGCQQTTVLLGKPRPLTLPASPGIQGTLFSALPDDETSYFDTLHAAAELIEDLLTWLRESRPLPAWIPREVFQQLALLGGKRLRGDEGVSVKALRRREPDPSSAPEDDYDYVEELEQDVEAVPPLRSAARTISRPADLPRAIVFDAGQERPQESPVLDAPLRAILEELGLPKAPELHLVQRTLSGEVTMVDVDGLAHGDAGRVRLRADGNHDDLVEIAFAIEHEQDVTRALHEHKRVRLRVRGEALVDERGRMKRFIAKQVVPIQSPTPDTPSEALFERLAVEDPERLLAMLVSNELRPALLTYAAEIAGRGLPSEQCVPVLIQLLHHGAAVVREGAVYGLAEHPGEVVTAKLRQVAENDSSAGVRAAATGALEDRENASSEDA